MGFFVKMGALKLTNRLIVRNAKGQIILSIPQTNSMQQLDLNHLAPGVYILEIIDEDGDKAIQKITITPQ